MTTEHRPDREWDRRGEQEFWEDRCAACAHPKHPLAACHELVGKGLSYVGEGPELCGCLQPVPWTGAARIAAERQRQIDVEHYDADHDAGNANELARAGAVYAMPDPGRRYFGGATVPDDWPWDDEWWKPTPDDRIRELVKAGALIAAAIDSLQYGADR